jgi:hypothetical protein
MKSFNWNIETNIIDTTSPKFKKEISISSNNQFPTSTSSKFFQESSLGMSPRFDLPQQRTNSALKNNKSRNSKGEMLNFQGSSSICGVSTLKQKSPIRGSILNLTKNIVFHEIANTSRLKGNSSFLGGYEFSSTTAVNIPLVNKVNEYSKNRPRRSSMDSSNYMNQSKYFQNLKEKESERLSFINKKKELSRLLEKDLHITNYKNITNKTNDIWVGRNNPGSILHKTNASFLGNNTQLEKGMLI